MDRLDADPDAQPSHVVRFGPQLHAHGVLSGSPDADRCIGDLVADRCIGYLVKYLTKSIDTCHDTQTPAQEAHLTRLWEALRFEPCSPTSANWLRYGIQPKHPRAGLGPGCCRGKAYRRETLGFGGRRVLVSRNWSTKTLGDHQADRRDWVRNLLGLPDDPDSGRYLWIPHRPTTPTYSPAKTGCCSPSQTAPAGETNSQGPKTPPDPTGTMLFRQLAHPATRERRLEPTTEA